MEQGAGAERAAALRRAADALEQQLPRFCALLVREAFKTWGDAVAEVREAVDFLRYYAAEAERIIQAPVALPGPTGESNECAGRARRVGLHQPVELSAGDLHAGQVAAALATGNTVLAKPAEQTPGVAPRPCAAARRRRAGRTRCSCCTARRDRGRGAGGAPGHAGVAFTGSTAGGARSSARWPPRTAPSCR
jgi:RHH-type proline utilization regulon transcriptional repressor/proline dehydrogenase/delta 1-pyrroline-5-carboxylate dehydrogenase